MVFLIPSTLSEILELRKGLSCIEVKTFGVFHYSTPLQLFLYYKFSFIFAYLIEILTHKTCYILYSVIIVRVPSIKIPIFFAHHSPKRDRHQHIEYSSFYPWFWHTLKNLANYLTPPTVLVCPRLFHFRYFFYIFVNTYLNKLRFFFHLLWNNNKHLLIMALLY